MNQIFNTQSFLKPEVLFKEIPFRSGMVVADFGCGNGYYAVAAAQLVGSRGQVYALDILEDALSRTAMLAKIKGILNLEVKLCDLEKIGECPIPDTSCDMVIVGRILHQVVNKENLLREGYRILKTGGLFLVIEWEPHPLLGPSAYEGFAKKDAKSLLEQFGFRPVHEISPSVFNYALLYSK